ncbi:MAG: glycosyltransferase family 2 protein [Methanobrevibacter sp.]|nr:glycosyltransferase family 2 protein [Methanobrevibacter sp.]
MSLLSIIVPCYNEEESIIAFYEEFISVYDNSIIKYNPEIEYELILVNDGSKDNTLKLLKELASNDANVKYISFSRNFGKESALYAGLKNSSGDYIAVMDADLQDPPNLLPEMIETLDREDYDIVATRRVSREGEPHIRSFFARTFYKLFNRISKVELVDGARDYRLMTRQVVDAILDLSEYNRFSKGIFSWVGFDTKWLEYKNIERVSGETSWSFWGLFKYAIEGVMAFTTVPLVISTVLGIIISFVSFLYLIYIVLSTILFGNNVHGWASTVSIILLLGGIQLLSIGILGQYLGKTYIETKNRPIYITKETNIEKE